MRLFDRKIKVDNKELYLTIDKTFYTHLSGKDYYTYNCYLYKKTNSFIFSKEFVYSYNTFWLNYYEYLGDLDKVIDETICMYKKELKDQKYIAERENNFKSKYEI